MTKYLKASNVQIKVGGKLITPATITVSSISLTPVFEEGQRVSARMWIEEHEEIRIVTLKERNHNYNGCWDAVGDDGTVHLVAQGQLAHLPQNGLTELIKAVKNEKEG
jgi:hypothetical protein